MAVASKIQMVYLSGDGLPFWCWLTQVCWGKKAVKWM